MPIYLDYNATTPLDRRVLEAMQPYLTGLYGNASSVHRYGRAARDAIEAARAQVAELVGARSRDVIFTAGATESNNLALMGGGLEPGRDRLLYGATEHPSVVEAAEALGRTGVPVETIAVDPDGLLDWPAFEAQLAAAPVRWVALMRANNETGVIQDVARAARLAHAAGARLHCDAVQAAGKIELDFDALGADCLSLSAHKFYGPKGVGALLKRADLELTPLLYGGGQEHGLRGGTENLAAIVGFGVAAELARREQQARAARWSALRRRLEKGLRAIPGTTIFGAGAPRLPNTSQFALAGWHGEALLMALDRRGVAVSSGSACASGKGQPSRVLLAMGWPAETALGAARVSFGRDSSDSDVDQLLALLGELHEQVELV